MFKLKNSLIALLGLLAVVGTIALITPRSTVGQKVAAHPSPIPPPFNVNVVNTPLPVTGTISVGNLGDSPLPVRDVDNPARQPFQGKLSISSPIVVPAGKGLVIEYVSTLNSATGGCRVLVFRIFTTVGGVTEEHIFPSQFAGTDFSNVSYYSVAQQARLYADPETSVVLNIAIAGFSGCGNRELVVSGYLVDVP